MSSTNGPRQHTGRRPGQSGTRDDILAAAARLFAKQGYNRASLRTIAAAAHVDQRLIAHYFGSKQQLFVAAVSLPFNPAEQLRSILAGDPAMARQRLAQIVERVVGEPDVHQRLVGVVRAAASEPEVARMLREFFRTELFEPASILLGSDDAAFRINLVGSQVVGLVMARYVLVLEPLASMAPEAVADAIAGTLHRYLFSPLHDLELPTPSTAGLGTPP